MKVPRVAIGISVALLAVTTLSVRESVAQGGPFSAGIENFWRLLSTGGRAFTTLSSATSGYHNFGTVLGASGYGIRDSAGVIQIKSSGGAWAAADAGSIDLTATVTGILPVANGGTGIASGTSGGILGFTGATTLASTPALAVGALVVGGGVGAVPGSVVDVATGSVLISGGLITNPSYSANPTLTSVALGTNPATIGAVRLANQTYLYSRNSANGADLFIIGYENSITNALLLGNSGNPVWPGADDAIDFGKLGQRWANAFFSQTVKALVFTGGTTPPSAGAIRSGTEGIVSNGPISLGSGAGVLAISNTAPTIGSGFNTSPTITNGSAFAFAIGTGTTPATNTGVINLPTATNGWSCQGQDLSDGGFVSQVASSVSSASFKYYSRTTGLVINWPASATITFVCGGR